MQATELNIPLELSAQPPPSPWRWLRSRLFLGCAGVLVFLLVWQWVGSHTNPLFFSTPTKIAQAVPGVFREDDLLSLYLGSMGVFAISLFISVVAGIGFGLLVGLSKPVRHFTEPLSIAAYSAPTLVLIPSFILWFGIGDLSKGALIFFAAFFPAMINTQLGVDQMGPLMGELGTAFGANRREALVKIVLPSIIPFSLAGIRLAVPRAFIALIAAEMLITTQGVGGLVLHFGNLFETTKYFVPVLLIIATSYLLTEAVKLLEQRLTRWKVS
jgi:NitT/TauT family transport system permease protein